MDTKKKRLFKRIELLLKLNSLALKNLSTAEEKRKGCLYVIPTERSVFPKRNSMDFVWGISHSAKARHSKGRGMAKILTFFWEGGILSVWKYFWKKTKSSKICSSTG